MDEQQTAEAKALLEGIIDTEHQSHVSIETTHAGTLMVLGVTYEEACKLVDDLYEEENLSKLIEWETFIWHGQRNSEMWTHRKSIKAGWVVGVIEVTDEQWKAYVLDHVQRQQQAMINQAQQSGLMQ